ncbi:MAG: hypothetical protein KJ595_19625, partial [Gammaproteobacteria bacterium]|nr:hypothetical protein [Gammaproteobacteria bacterium]
GAHLVQQLVDLEPLPVSLVESFLKVAHGLSPLTGDEAALRRMMAIWLDGRCSLPTEKRRILRWPR